MRHLKAASTFWAGATIVEWLSLSANLTRDATFPSPGLATATARSGDGVDGVTTIVKT